MIAKQQRLNFSTYSDLYEICVPKNNQLRQIKELVDFGFIYEELRTKYCPDNGRNAIDPLRLFKYLLLKVIDNLSDVGVVERSLYDLSYKYFLDLSPEETNLIDPSTLTKFRKLRLKDSDMLDLLIGKTVKIAIEKGLINSKNIIVDSTHTAARYNQKSPREILMNATKLMRKDIYRFGDEIKKEFPEKPNNGLLEDEVVYSQKLLEVIRKKESLANMPTVKENIRMVEEILGDIKEADSFSNDPDARVGHKTADTAFYGYKTHLAMTEERIITAAVVTSGEKHDGKQLKTLVEKTKEAGVEVETVIGDAAYSEKENLEYAENNDMEIVAKLSSTVTNGNRKKEDEFFFNKDAGMFVCPAGHMAVKAVKSVYKKHPEKTPVFTYFFNVEKCKHCPMKQDCYKEGAATKSYSVSQTHGTHNKQKAFQETERFKELSKERYKIEAKNAELKMNHGYRTASASGLCGMEMQGAFTIFAVNLKRIVSLLEEKTK